jgi:hypothetical protein
LGLLENTGHATADMTPQSDRGLASHGLFEATSEKMDGGARMINKRIQRVGTSKIKVERKNAFQRIKFSYSEMDKSRSPTS